LIHFNLQTLKINGYNPFNPITLIKCIYRSTLKQNVSNGVNNSDAGIKCV